MNARDLIKALLDAPPNADVRFVHNELISHVEIVEEEVRLHGDESRPFLSIEEARSKVFDKPVTAFNAPLVPIPVGLNIEQGATLDQEVIQTTVFPPTDRPAFQRNGLPTDPALSAMDRHLQDYLDRKKSGTLNLKEIDGFDSYDSGEVVDITELVVDEEDDEAEPEPFKYAVGQSVTHNVPGDPDYGSIGNVKMVQGSRGLVQFPKYQLWLENDSLTSE